MSRLDHDAGVQGFAAGLLNAYVIRRHDHGQDSCTAVRIRLAQLAQMAQGGGLGSIQNVAAGEQPARQLR